MFQKAKATKLPLPKTLAEKTRDQRNQTPSPTGIPKPSTFSSGGSGAQSGSRDQERDHYWTKLRDKFEKDLASSALSQRTSYVRSRESDKNQASIQSNHWQQSKYNASASREDNRGNSGANPRTGIPTPSTNRSAAQNTRDSPLQSDSQKEWIIQEGQWVTNDSREATPHKSDRTDTTTESSPRSQPSVSPVSAEGDSSMTEWEDRFVVHMPSAKEPNPPTMTAQQIAEYQRSIERMHRDGGQFADPNTRASPRNGTPEKNASPESQRDRTSGNSSPFKAYDGHPMHPQPQAERQSEPPAAPQPQGTLGPQGQPHYYSPDEIGKNRISTIWEEQSPSKSKDKRYSANADGSFLGCKEINGPGTKNPDEVLLFNSGEDSATLQPRPLAVNAKKKLKEEKKTSAFRALRKSAENNAVQEEWKQISRNSKHAQCSKPSQVTICQDQDCSNAIPRSDSQGSSKENYHPTESESSSPEKLEDGRGEDDVFIITPTITRTMIPTPTPEKQAKKEERKVSGPKPSGLRRPGGIGLGGTGEAVKAVRAKAQVISTPSGLRPAAAASQNKSTAPSTTSSKTIPLSSIPTAKDVTSAKENRGKDDAAAKDSSPKKDIEKSAQQATNSIRGFIRTSGLTRSTGLVRSPTDSIASILRNGTESLRNRAESLRNGNGSLTSRKSSPISQPSGPSRDNSESSRSERSFRSAREKATPPPTAKTPPVTQDSPASKIVAEKQTSASNPASMGKSSPAEKSPPSEKSDRSSRAERLEKIKAQARLRRATKVVEIAELDGQQVQSNKDHLQPNITDVCDDFGELDSRDKDASPKDGVNAVALSMIFEIVVVAVSHMHKFVLHMTDSPYANFMMTNVLNMTRHCYRVFSKVYRAVSRYQTTGTWPKAKNDQAISRFLVELLQAVAYMFILGFGVVVIGRTASYVVLVGSWIVWFARPFAWMFQCVARALIN